VHTRTLSFPFSIPAGFSLGATTRGARKVKVLIAQHRYYATNLASYCYLTRQYGGVQELREDRDTIR